MVLYSIIEDTDQEASIGCLSLLIADCLLL